MQKWAGMLVETGKAFVDPSAMVTQMKEDSGFWGLRAVTILCWRTHLVITKHPEDEPGIAQMDNTAARLITSSEEALPIRSEHCQNTKFSRGRHWKQSRLADDDLPPSLEKKISKPKHTRLKLDLEKL